MHVPLCDAILGHGGRIGEAQRRAYVALIGFGGRGRGAPGSRGLVGLEVAPLRDALLLDERRDANRLAHVTRVSFVLERALLEELHERLEVLHRLGGVDWYLVDLSLPTALRRRPAVRVRCRWLREHLHHGLHARFGRIRSRDWWMAGGRARGRWCLCTAASSAGDTVDLKHAGIVVRDAALVGCARVDHVVVVDSVFGVNLVAIDLLVVVWFVIVSSAAIVLIVVVVVLTHRFVVVIVGRNVHLIEAARRNRWWFRR